MDMKNDLLDVFHRNSVLAESRITELRTEIQKQISVKNMIQSRLEEASREPGILNIGNCLPCFNPYV